MKPTFLFLIILVFFNCRSFSQTWQWAHAEPNGDSSANESDFAYDTETDTSGNVYVLGYFNDSLFLNNIYRATGNGSYLAKYDNAGNLLWYKLIKPSTPSAGFIAATHLTVNPLGIFITGQYSRPNGTYNCGSGTDYGPDYTYNIGSASFTASTIDIGIFIAKLNTNGGVGWIKTGKQSPCIVVGPGDTTYYGPGLVEYNPIITSDKSNNIVVAFVFGTNNINSPFTLGGDVIPVSQNNNSHLNIIALKYSVAGTLKWSNYASDSNAAVVTDCNAIITDNNNNIFLLGLANNNCGFGSVLYHPSAPWSYSTFIAKLSPSGVWQFAKELCNNAENTLNDGSTYGTANRLAVDNSNNVYAIVQPTTTSQLILGHNTGKSTVSNFLVKMTNNGGFLWDKFFGDSLDNFYAAGVCYNSGYLYVCGAGNDSRGFSSLYAPADSVNEIAAYVAKADLNGNFKWATFLGTDGYQAWASSLKVVNGTIYTCGNYMHSITNLGNLNGSFTNNVSGVQNIFFGKLSDQYISVGAVFPTTACTSTTITIPFTSSGLVFSGSNTFTAELSDHLGSFTNPTTIGNVVSTGSGTINAAIPSGLASANGYRLRIRSSDTLKTGYNYYAYADTGYAITISACPPPTTGLAATNITDSSSVLNWDPVACAVGYRVQYWVKGTTTLITKNILSNNGTLAITGLAPATIYQWRTSTKCKNGSTVSYSVNSRTQTFTTAAASRTAYSNTFDASTAGKTLAGEIKLYPNPANMQASLSFTASKPGKYTVEITDISGKILQVQSGQKVIGLNVVNIEMSKYAKGVYIVNLMDNDAEKKCLKLVKE